MNRSVRQIEMEIDVLIAIIAILEPLTTGSRKTVINRALETMKGGDHD